MESLKQVGALPVREGDDGKLLVLLVTSRETRRRVIPKGWPMKSLRDRDAAAREAEEEAGVKGRVGRKPLGSYSYWKRTAEEFKLIEVDVFVLEVSKEKKTWPEMKQRERAWLPLRDAADIVQEPGLRELIKSLKQK